MAYKLKTKEGKDRKHNGEQVLASDFLGVVKAVDLEKRTLRIRATDETRDRDGDIISVKGWNLDNYLKNPVFLWSHDYSSVPLAAAVKIVKKNSPKRIVMTHKFPSEGLYPFADMILNLYHQRIINAGSVGFVSNNWEKIEADDDYPFGRHFKTQELLEHSGCAVPCNPNAIQESIKNFGYDKDSKLYANFIAGKEEFAVEPKDENAENEIKELLEKGAEYEEETTTMVQVPEDIEKSELPEDAEDIERMEVEEKPYKNEHACRLNDPSKYDRFARKNCAQKVDDKCIDVIYGVKDNKAEIQALRYPKDVWSKDAAKNHCDSRKGTFEAAAETSLEEEELAAMAKLEKALDEIFEEPEEKNTFIELSRLFNEVLETYIADSLIQQKNSLKDKFDLLLKQGAVLNRKNKARLNEASKLIREVLDEANTDEEITVSIESQQNEAPVEETGVDGVVAKDYFDITPPKAITTKQLQTKVVNGKQKKDFAMVRAVTRQLEAVLNEANRTLTNLKK